MPSPVTPDELLELLPKKTDDFCAAMEKAAGFDSAVLSIMQWMFDQCGNINQDGIGVDVCSEQCTTTSTSTSTSTTSTSTSTTTTAATTSTTTAEPECLPSAYWKMDEASNVDRVDSTAGGNTLVDTDNLVAAGSGKINNGSVFVSPSNHFLSAPITAELSFAGSWSVGCWVKFASLSDFQYLVHTEIGGDFMLWYSAGVVDRVSLVFNSAFVGYLLDPTPDIWYYVTVTRDAGTGDIKGYINSSLVLTGNDSGSPATDATLKVGKGGNCIIDELGKWNCVLTQEQIAAYYNGGSGARPPLP